jgi:hypothetical protein
MTSDEELRLKAMAMAIDLYRSNESAKMDVSVRMGEITKSAGEIFAFVTDGRKQDHHPVEESRIVTVTRIVKSDQQKPKQAKAEMMNASAEAMWNDV